MKNDVQYVWVWHCGQYDEDEVPVVFASREAFERYRQWPDNNLVGMEEVPMSAVGSVNYWWPLPPEERSGFWGVLRKVEVLK